MTPQACAGRELEQDALANAIHVLAAIRRLGQDPRTRFWVEHDDLPPGGAWCVPAAEIERIFTERNL